MLGLAGGAEYVGSGRPNRAMRNRMTEATVRNRVGCIVVVMENVRRGADTKDDRDHRVGAFR